MSITTAIAELSKIFSAFFAYETERTERQSETTVIKKQKNVQKAIDTAEKIIFFCDKLVEEKVEDKKQQKEYEKLRKRFFKYN
jgi:hypothetical protein